ncbi:hypothetical protein IAU60_005840 [Kwoniella sp. DSM 27419]
MARLHLVIKSLAYVPLVHFLFSSQILDARAQSTNATCSDSDTTSWMFNAAGESPCLVWSKIQALCLDENAYINVPPLLDPSYSYNLPTGQSSACQCNIVSYNLMAACADCQWSTTALPSESAWSASCTNYSSSGLGFEQSAVVLPPWAYHQWSGAAFDPNVARAMTSVPAPTSYPTTLSRSFSSSGSSAATSTSALQTSVTNPHSPASPSDTPTADPHAEGKATTSETAPIVGGVVAGLAVLAVGFLLYRWYFSRRAPRRGRVPIEDKERIGFNIGEGGSEGDMSFREMMAGGSGTGEIGSSGKGRQEAGVRMGVRPQHDSTAPSSGDAGESQLKGPRADQLRRDTAQFMADPSTFAQPRIAPVPPSAGSSIRSSMMTPLSPGTPKSASSRRTISAKAKARVKARFKRSSRRHDGNSPRYLTTSQRLAQRNSSGSDVSSIDKIAYPAGTLSSTHTRPHTSIDFSTPTPPPISSTYTSSISSLSPSIASPKDLTHGESASRTAPPLTPTRQPAVAMPTRARHPFAATQDHHDHRDRPDIPSMDFSLPPSSPDNLRPGSLAPTLPSLYEPRAGAPRYRASAATRHCQPDRGTGRESTQTVPTVPEPGSGVYNSAELHDRVKASRKSTGSFMTASTAGAALGGSRR